MKVVVACLCALLSLTWATSCPRVFNLGGNDIGNHQTTKAGPHSSVEELETNDKLGELLLAIDKVFGTSVCYWVDSGTLLGVYRHADIVRHDHDVDLGIAEVDYENAWTLLQTLDSSMYSVENWDLKGEKRHLRVYSVKSKTNLFADIYSYTVSEDSVAHPWSMSGSFDDFFPLRQMKFSRVLTQTRAKNGVCDTDKLVWVPNRASRLLEQTYGQDYMTPAKVFDWSTMSYVSRNGDMPNHPLVSLVMPTHQREQFIAKSLELAYRQDYPLLELVIVDDSPVSLLERGFGPLFDSYRAKGLSITYEHLPVMVSLGLKRNRAVQLAQGEIIVHWDDDDFFRPHRVSSQVASLINGEAEITTFDHRYYFSLKEMQFYLLQRMENWGPHLGTLAYMKRLWAPLELNLVTGISFPNNSVAEDFYFTEKAIRAGARIKVLDSDGSHVYVRHYNTWNFELRKDSKSYAIEEIDVPSFMPMCDMHFYNSLDVETLKRSSTPINHFANEDIDWDCEDLKAKSQPSSQYSFQYANYFRGSYLGIYSSAYMSGQYIRNSAQYVGSYSSSYSSSGQYRRAAAKYRSQYRKPSSVVKSKLRECVGGNKQVNFANDECEQTVAAPAVPASLGQPDVATPVVMEW
eukprot:GILJ01003843.1.p1 GENE.GILJ01003843.1~~GILJ01003843.1.p1  ORF type:complete len:631 (-),score=69.52 GILJ01003843.1:209-2101(-)